MYPIIRRPNLTCPIPRHMVFLKNKNKLEQSEHMVSIYHWLARQEFNVSTIGMHGALIRFAVSKRSRKIVFSFWQANESICLYNMRLDDIVCVRYRAGCMENA